MFPPLAGTILLGCAASIQDSWLFGASIAVLDDLDADGIGELAISEPYDEEDDPGRIWVVSPASGDVLAVWDGEKGLGVDLAVLSDVDGDGARDLIAANPERNRAIVHVLSGRSGEVRLRIEWPGGIAHFGADVEALDDVDADGMCDLAVLTEDGVHAFSTRNGNWIWSFAQRDPWGAVVLRDARGAGDDRMLVWTQDETHLLDVRTGLEIRDPSSLAGLRLAAATGVGDIDADGVEDLVLLAEPSSQPGLRLASGCTTETIARFAVPTSWSDEPELF